MTPMLQQMVKGNLKVSDSIVHDWIQRWQAILPLPEYLGMKWEDYRLWIGGTSIRDIVARRKLQKEGS